MRIAGEISFNNKAPIKLDILVRNVYRIDNSASSAPFFGNSVPFGSFWALLCYG